MDPSLLLLGYLFLRSREKTDTTVEKIRRIERTFTRKPKAPPAKPKPKRRRRRRPPTTVEKIRRIERKIAKKTVIKTKRTPTATIVQTKTSKPATGTKPATVVTKTTTTTKATATKPTTTKTTKTERPVVSISRRWPLERRAQQKRARGWIPDLKRQGAPPDVAEGLARWIGIESSGEPLARSSIGERGLLQATKSSGRRIFTPAEWEKLASQATARSEHARLAMKQYRYHKRRAKRWVSNPPHYKSADWIWYAKLHHTRPVMLRRGKVHGPAQPMARDLWTRWKGEGPKVRQRLALANVSAFGRVFV